MVSAVEEKMKGAMSPQSSLRKQIEEVEQKLKLKKKVWRKIYKADMGKKIEALQELAEVEQEIGKIKLN